MYPLALRLQLAGRDLQNASNANYNDSAGSLKNPVQITIPTAELGLLTIASNTVSAAAAANTVVSAIGGKTAGSTLTVVSPADDRYKITGGSNLARGATAITNGSFTMVTVRETRANSVNNPRDTTFKITATA